MTLTGTEAATRLKENEERLDVFLNSTGVYTTRFSETVETMPSLMARLKAQYLVTSLKGAWVTSTTYVTNDLVTSSGVIYICVSAHTAGTFATDLASGYWAVYQGLTAADITALKADMSSTTDALKGSGMLGYANSLAYASGTIGKAVKTLESNIISTATTYYVRTDGNDSNTGLSDDASGAFLTILKAFETVSSKILNAQVTIRVRTAPVIQAFKLPRCQGSITPAIYGDTTTPSNCPIATSSSKAIWTDSDGVFWKIGGFKISNSVGDGIVCFGNSQIDIDGRMEYGTIAGNAIKATDKGTIRISNDYTISGSQLRHIFARRKSSVIVREEAQTTTTLTGTPAFSTAFCEVTDLSFVRFNTAFSGSGTGVRYIVSANSLIQSGGSTLPGGTAGSTTTGGQYI